MRGVAPGAVSVYVKCICEELQGRGTIASGTVAPEPVSSVVTTVVHDPGHLLAEADPGPRVQGDTPEVHRSDAWVEMGWVG